MAALPPPSSPAPTAGPRTASTPPWPPTPRPSAAGAARPAGRIRRRRPPGRGDRRHLRRRGARGRSTPVLVDCWAAWCGPCRMIAPTIDQLAAESAGRYRVAKLDVDANPRTAAAYRIDGIPALLLFKGGKPGRPARRPPTQARHRRRPGQVDLTRPTQKPRHRRGRAPTKEAPADPELRHPTLSSRPRPARSRRTRWSASPSGAGPPASGARTPRPASRGRCGCCGSATSFGSAAWSSPKWVHRPHCPS